MSSEKRTDELIDQFKRAGLTQNAIAAKLGVSRQYISKRVRANEEIYRSPRDRVRDSWPIEDTRFGQSNLERRLRDHLEYRDPESNLPEWKRSLLSQWYRYLVNTDSVVEFDPTIKPGEYDEVGGYRYARREAVDRNLVLRINKYVRSSPSIEVLLIMPMEFPDGTLRPEELFPL